MPVPPSPDHQDHSRADSLPGVRSLLFVCMGNICRSPLGKAVFVSLARERGVHDRFTVDSCGTGRWHVGSDADPRTLAVAKKYNVPISHRARQLAPLYDFARFDLVLAMDRQNIDDMLRAGAPSDPARLRRLREFDPLTPLDPAARTDHALDVPDPYYGGADGFDRMYHMIRPACDGLLDALTRPPDAPA